MLHTTLDNAHQYALMLAGTAPDPGAAETPPGSDGVLKLLRWGLWLAACACLAGLIKAGGSMALAGSGRSSGGAHEHGMGAALALLGFIISSSAALIVGSLA